MLGSDHFRLFVELPLGLSAIRWVAFGAAIALVVWPSRCRYLMPLLFVGILTLDAATKSLGGYVGHGQLVPLVLLGVFTLFTNSHFVSPMAALRGPGPVPVGDQTHYDGMILVCSIALIVPYTFIGLNRILEGGLTVFSGRALLDYVWVNSLRDSDYGFAVFANLIASPVVGALLKVGFVVTTIFEVLSAGVLVYPVFRRAWIIFMTSFHVMTMVSMNILFWENLVLIYAVIGVGLGAVRAAPRAAPRV